MVDAVDSKSTSSNTVWVQVPSPVPINVKHVSVKSFGD